MILTPRRLFIAILFIALFVIATREIADPDFWWHLRTGQFIVETRSIPHADIFSYTNAGRPWVTHEWLSQVFIYALYRLGAFPTLIVAFAAIIALSFALVFVRSEGQPYVAALVLLLTALATAPTWGVRPQMISLLSTSIFLWVLEKNRRERKSRWLWLLIPLTILWVNLHSGFAVGLALIAVYLVGDIGESGQPVAGSKQRIGYLALVFFLCLIVVPLNPNGVTMYLYPFETLTSRAMQTYIQEWFSPDFHLTEFQPFAWLLLATPASIALSGKRVALTHILLLVLFGYAGLRSARHIPIFALVAAPILTEHLWDVLKARGWSSALESNVRISRGMVLVNWILLLAILVVAIWRVSLVVANQSAVERAKFPAAAADFLQAQQLTLPLYNSYGWGGYLIWRLYPETRVFIDGRADVYGDAFIEVFLKAYRAGPDWHVPLDRYAVQVVLIESNAPLATELAQEAGWKKIYADPQAIIFQKQ
jgi:hypothetical protein